MRKKSQSISINAIIIAAIALVVLVVLFAIFTGRFKIFSEGVEGTGVSCEDSCKFAGYKSWTGYGGPGAKPNLECEFPNVKLSGAKLPKDQICCCVP
ncbi:hypothetical protein HYX02_07900 [Candidatus Woesearchaeota archaeon]|nr:hypothetical protein [Candidatus Woesearchaeota archaeon]